MMVMMVMIQKLSNTQTKIHTRRFCSKTFTQEFFTPRPLHCFYTRRLSHIHTDRCLYAYLFLYTQTILHKDPLICGRCRRLYIYAVPSNPKVFKPTGAFTIFTPAEQVKPSFQNAGYEFSADMYLDPSLGFMGQYQLKFTKSKSAGPLAQPFLLEVSPNAGLGHTLHLPRPATTHPQV